MLVVPVTALSLYIAGTALNIAYRLMRIAELKVDHDTTRSKDVKNECMALTRHHMGGLRSSWKWPTVVVTGTTAALKWGKSLDVK
jgi:hypothetical protein